MKLRALFIVAAAGSALLSSQAVEASTASSSVRATAITLSPTPTLAPEGTLAPGQQVSVTLTAHHGTAIAPNALVWISLEATNPSGHLYELGTKTFGTLTVNGTPLQFNGNGYQYQYQVNASGVLTMTYTAATTSNLPPKAGFSDGIYAKNSDHGKGDANTLAYSTYTYTS
jgi:hypothetical protein